MLNGNKEVYFARRRSVGMAQILMTASSLDVKGNKAVQKNCFSRYLVGVPKYGPIVLKKWAYVGIFKTY